MSKIRFRNTLTEDQEDAYEEFIDYLMEVVNKYLLELARTQLKRAEVESLMKLIMSAPVEFLLKSFKGDLPTSKREALVASNSSRLRIPRVMEFKLMFSSKGTKGGSLRDSVPFPPYISAIISKIVQRESFKEIVGYSKRDLYAKMAEDHTVITDQKAG